MENNKGKIGDVPKPVVARTPADIQRLKLEKLMKNPDKPVIIPEKPKERGAPVVPDFVRNVMGSSAGAGSGEFHVYRHLRRKEYARQHYMSEKARWEKLEDEYHDKILENKRKAEEETAKKRAKRLKKKQNAKKKGRGGGAKAKSPTPSSSESEEEEEEEGAVEISEENENGITKKEEEESAKLPAEAVEVRITPSNVVGKEEESSNATVEGSRNGIGHGNREEIENRITPSSDEALITSSETVTLKPADCVESKVTTAEQKENQIIGHDDFFNPSSKIEKNDENQRGDERKIANDSNESTQHTAPTESVEANVGNRDETSESAECKTPEDA